MINVGVLKAFAFGLVVAVVIFSLFADWFRKASARSGLADRQAFDDEQFQRTFYAGNSQLADTATRVRKVLAKNLDMPLDSVRPEDRLDDDLRAQLEGNPDLFWQLEEEFDISTGYEDLEVFEKTAEQLVTFSDLVEYVRNKINQAATRTPERKKKVALSDRIYLFLAELVPPACVASLVIAFIGSLLGFDAAWRFGSGVFMLGFVLLIIALFNIGIDNLTMEIRKQGMVWIREHPFRTAWVGFIVAAMLYMSFTMLRGILHIFAGVT
jgi:acyl carrier protein